jgi:hypothetical protein
VLRDRVEWFLGLANLFVWTVFTPILCLILAAMLQKSRHFSPYTDAEKAREKWITACQVGCIFALVPALLLVGLVLAVCHSYSYSEEYGADIRDPATDKPLPTTVVFTRHLPPFHPVLGWPLALWWGVGGLLFAFVNATRKGLTMSPTPTQGTTIINPVDYAVFWIIGSTYVLGLSSGVAIALAIKAMTRSERKVIAFWRLRYWYCLLLALTGYVLSLLPSITTAPR